MSRLLVWILALAGIQVCRWMGWGHIPVAGLLLVILGLLCTTPGDALRLPRWVSDLVVLAGSFSMSQHGGWALIHLAIVMVMLLILRLWEKSAWWAVLFAWF